MRALSRKTASRKSLLRNLATSLVLYEKIQTTEAKAKEVRSEVEHLIALAKKNDLATRRILLAYFLDKNATKKVLEVLVPRYNKINSGFIKSYRKGNRLGDGAMIVIMELKKVDIEAEDTKKAQDGEKTIESKIESKDGNAKKVSSKQIKTARTKVKKIGSSNAETKTSRQVK